jgi:localization factor PodJL
MDPFNDPVFAEDTEFVTPGQDDPFAPLRQARAAEPAEPSEPRVERRSIVRRDALEALRAGEPLPHALPEEPFIAPTSSLAEAPPHEPPPAPVAEAWPSEEGWSNDPEPAFEPAPQKATDVPFGPQHEKLLAAFDDVDFGDESFGSVGDTSRGSASNASTFSATTAEPERVSTRDLIERARSAARQSHQADTPQKDKNESKGGPFGLNISLPKRKSKGPGGGTASLLLASAVSITVTATVLGYLIVNDSNSDGGRSESLIAHRDARPKTRTTTEAAPVMPDQLAVATSPDPAASLPAQGVKPGGDSTDAKDVYQAAANQLDAGNPKGIATLTKAATLGYGPAEFHLSTLYDKGASGAPKDAAKARMWVERAAQSGVPKAMYNLGLFLFDGKGGPPDLPAAAAWFRKAADLGLGDAQYNLARLYENGYGVQQNAGQAYTWYLIAANGGDQDARADATRIRASLDKNARTAAERAANAFHAASSATEEVASGR